MKYIVAFIIALVVTFALYVDPVGGRFMQINYDHDIEGNVLDYQTLNQ